ncbi:MAG: LTA synthase family protein [Oscillospiraceae bacterium]|nr:LTA synthase family protein [Oscillospiraceae bacterium]
MKLVEEKENPGSRLLRQGESLKHRLGEYLSRLAGNLGEIRASLLWWMGRIPLLRRLLDQKVRRRLGGILLVCSPLLLTFCCQLITLRSFEKSLLWFSGHGPASLLTVLVLFLAELALLMALGRPVWAVLLTALPITVLAVVSTVKELVNGVPLLLSDFSMAGQAGSIAGFLRPGMSWGRGTIPALGLLFLLILALGLLYKGFSLAPGRYRAVGCEFTVVLLALVLFTSPLQVFAAGEEGESQAGRNQRLGLLLGLYSAGVENVMAEPGDYTQDHLNRILLELEAQAEPSHAPEVRPHVVLLVSESFFDPTLLPGLSFDRDPILNFRALSRTWPTGTFLSNTYGGGTGNVEMELLTGIPSAFLGAGESLTTLADPTVYSRLPSVVKAFSAQGYETVMLHTYTDSLYNRGENLPQLGFDRTLYQEDFPKGSHEEGGFLSDHTLTQELIRQFEQREGPVFLYGLSMENHPPYHAGKFSQPSYLGTKAQDLDREGLEVMDALAHGLRDADAALGELLDYFDQQEEPVLVVFLGDHLPGLYINKEDTLYTAMGYSSSSNTQEWGPEEMKRMHSTTFLVWNNYGAEPEVPQTLSCSNLGAELLAWAGVERPLYFQWVDRASREVLLYRSRLFVAGDGRAYETPPQECGETVAVWRNLIYDLLYGQGYVAPQVTGASPGPE